MNTTETAAAKGLTSNALKLIAIAAMTVDHLTWAFFPGTQKIWYVILLHLIGRITAPIMWFFVAEGYHYTRNAAIYAVRLFAFAFISHFAYCFAFGIPFLPLSTGVFNQTSVLWSLAFSVVLLQILNTDKIPELLKIVSVALVCVITFPSDWSCIAVVAVLYINMHRGNFGRQMFWMMVWVAVYALVYFVFIDRLYGILQLGVCLSIPLLHLYNGRRGDWRGMKWLFYIYYPAHLAAVGIVRLLLHGNVGIIF